MSVPARARGLLRLAVATEWRMYVGAARLLGRRPDVPAGATPVGYAATVAAPLWAFTIVSAVELVALHLVIPWERVRLVADVVGIWGVLWCLGMTGCHYVYPHLLTDDALVVRNAARTPVVVVPWALVASAGARERSHESGRRVQVIDGGGEAADALVVPVGKQTGVHVTLSVPVEVVVDGTARRVDRLLLAADAPRELAASVRTRSAVTWTGGTRP